MVLVHSPDVDITFIVSCCEEGAITGNADARNRNIVFWDKLVRALVIAQIPDHEYSAAISADQLALVGMDYDVVDRVVMGVVPLNGSRSCIPYSYSAVLRACNHPFPFAMECDACNVVGMAFEGHDCIWVARLDIVQPDDMPPRGSKVLLVGSYT